MTLPGVQSAASDAPLPGPARRHPGLDGLRGVSVLLIMWLHFTHYGGMEPGIALDRAYVAIARSAWWGVDLFFVLSGFLITGILLDAKGHPGYFRTFYTRRALRIFPLYYAVLFAAFVVLPWLVSPAPALQRELEIQAWYWSYTLNVRIALEGWTGLTMLGHFWSLAVEEQFYLVWPLVVLVCSRRGLRAVCLGLLAGCLVLRGLLVLDGPTLAAYVLTPARMDALAAGGLLAVTLREPAQWQRLVRWTAPVGLAATALIGGLWLRYGWLASDTRPVQTLGFSLTAILSAILVVVAVEGSPWPRLARALQSPTLRFFGRYSYGLYVFHHLLVFPLAEQLRLLERVPRLAGSQLPGQLLFTLVATGVSVSAALLSWHALEYPFLRLKHLFPTHGSALPTPDGELRRVSFGDGPGGTGGSGTR